MAGLWITPARSVWAPYSSGRKPLARTESVRPLGRRLASLVRNFHTSCAAVLGGIGQQSVRRCSGSNDPSLSRPMRTHRRIAFTVVEMLAVAAIIGTLIALTLPAIQAARESARCAHCKNNLKQLSLAALNHLDVHGHFPTGGWSWYWVGDPDRGFGKDQPGGWFYNILPFCEESAALHDLAADGQPNDLTRVQRVGSAQVIQSPLAIVNCPTRRRNALYPLVANEGGDIGFFNSITPSFAGRS